eukprot:CAMPEP_0119506760 /NCGR_PEP_ID=MMETSP1344-20130328/26871_1 /TAXON_ID=236787 /ORGANISM="Florenciella parvula, Strain CCMP2471" /LENGTH=77 /DNA_ID=CAMNT_0007543329 /DNA_START=448 /DNA_END=678 /DNA_ORIENTATION=-
MSPAKGIPRQFSDLFLTSRTSAPLPVEFHLQNRELVWKLWKLRYSYADWPNGFMAVSLSDRARGVWLDREGLDRGTR